MAKKDDEQNNKRGHQIDYKTLFLKAPLPGLIFELDTGQIIHADELFCVLSGYAEQQLINLSFYKTTILRPQQKMKEFIRRIQQEEPLPLFTMDFKTADGGTLFVKVNYSTFTNNHRKLVLLTITDTSSQRRILESLKHHLTMERIIMHIATHYINISLEESDAAIEKALGEIARFVQADRAYVFQYHFHEGLTTNTFEWCAPGISPQKENLQKVPLSMVPQWVERHKNGEDMYIEDVDELEENGLKKLLKAQHINSLLAVPMMKGKECLGFVGFDSVKTQHAYTQKEKKLLYLFSQLLVNIQMRQALIEAEEEASQLSHAKTAFLSNLSHEIRTPLSGITAAIETVLELEKDPTSHYLLEMALNSSLQMEKVFSDLYEIALLSSEKIEVHPVKMNPSAFLDEIYHLFQISTEEKGLLLAIQKKRLPGTILADQSLIRQILDKLVENAIKFSFSGTITITADYFETVKKHGTLILKVSDEGIGIDAHTQQEIFKTFYQKDLSLTKEFSGLGLGLPIINSIVNKMNGKIFLESVEGKGSTFTVRLPVMEP